MRASIFVFMLVKYNKYNALNIQVQHLKKSDATIAVGKTTCAFSAVGKKEVL